MNRKEATNLAIKTLNVEDNKAEAEWLVALSLNIKRSEVYSSVSLSKEEEEVFFSNLAKRKQDIPLAYIIGLANFYGYDLKVNESVLIPRPETEELVLEVLKHVSKDSSVLDIGTGSGAIAVAIQKQCGAKVTAVDVSDQALTVAKENARINNAEIEFIKSDVFENLKNRKFNIIVSNPPYISTTEYEHLEKSVKKYEPKLALCDGEDGLKFYKKIIKNAHKYLLEGGKVFFEIGYNQAEDVKKLFEENGFVNVILKKDLQGQDRIVYAIMKEI